MKTMFMYPTSGTSLILGKYLLSNDHSLYLYCPNEVHIRQAGTIPFDLKVAALGLSETVQVVENLDQLSEMDFIVYPNLDVLPHDRRSDFGLICRDIFRYHLQNY